MDTIGIIGFGRFGSFIARVINSHFRNLIFKVYDPVVKKSDLKCVEFVKLKEVCQCKTILICVPISKFKKVTKLLSKHIKPHTLIIDTCSVKTHPSNIMRKYLPSSVSIIASHPMFGPDSAKKSVQGFNLVLCNISCEKRLFNSVHRTCKKLGLNVVVITPEKHDELVSRSQLFIHLVARLAEELRISPTKIDTPSFKNFLNIKNNLVNDSYQLFVDMIKFNPYAKKQIRKMNKILISFYGY